MRIRTWKGAWKFLSSQQKSHINKIRKVTGWSISDTMYLLAFRFKPDKDLFILYFNSVLKMYRVNSKKALERRIWL